MAEEKKPSASRDALIFIGIILLLAAVWIARGATGADVKGIFLAPPGSVAPGSYGPNPLNVSTTTNR